MLTNDITQYKNTISAQRDTMTGNMIKFEEKIQESKQAMQNEITQLKQTIAMLREKLEGHNGK